MRRIRGVILAAVLAFATFGVAKPAGAMVCDPELQTACAVVAKVVCGVLAKGRPCLA